MSQTELSKLDSPRLLAPKAHHMSLNFIAPGSTAATGRVSLILPPPTPAGYHVTHSQYNRNLCAVGPSSEKTCVQLKLLPPIQVKPPQRSVSRPLKTHRYHPYIPHSPDSSGSRSRSNSPNNSPPFTGYTLDPDHAPTLRPINPANNEVAPGYSGPPFTAYPRTTRQHSLAFPSRSRQPSAPTAALPTAASAVAAVRPDRPEYDNEELFAVVYLRIRTPHSQWKDHKAAFDRLFPPGSARRPGSPAPEGKQLPARYPTRTVGGLECRYYRIRDDRGMRKVRENRRSGGGGSGSSSESASPVGGGEEGLELVGLRAMEREALVRRWVQGLGAERRASWGLGCGALGEGWWARYDEGWWARATGAYRAESQFWHLLRAVGGIEKGCEL